MSEHETMIPKEAIKVLIIGGGHDCDRVAFLEMFSAIPSVIYTVVVQPQANTLIATSQVSEYDVLLFYDMMLEELQSPFQHAYQSLLEVGKAVIFLHHSLASYPWWAEFPKITGGRYFVYPTIVEGVEQVSTYRRDVTIKVMVADPNHPVTRGIEAFEIQDEVYSNVTILPKIKPLLYTDHPDSMRNLAWVNRYGNTDVLYIQLGHGRSAYSNPIFRRLIQQSVEWSATHHSHSNITKKNQTA
jgi:uncharacterized protein